MNIAVAGAGFVGIVHAAVMARQGNKVILFDVNEQRVQDLIAFCEGKTDALPIHEAGLPESLRQMHKENLLFFTTDARKAIQQSTIIFIAVGTPPDAEGKADLKYVDAIAHECGKVLKEQRSYKIIVNKSTVPVGTAKRVEAIIKQWYDGAFDVVSNPETLAEGTAVRDAWRPNRIIVGARSERAKKIFQDIYAPFFSPQQEKIFFMSPESAELTKYACNTYLASQVVLTNIFANVAKRTGANWREMIPAILGDERIGKFVYPGLGFGGSCFRKDVSQLYNTIKEQGFQDMDATVLQKILEQNESQKLQLNKVLETVYPELPGLTLAVWGLSFKKDTNDIRDAASLVVIPELVRRGVKIRAHDPQAGEEYINELRKMQQDVSKIHLCKEKYETLDGADGLLILNDWKTYRQPDLAELRKRLKQKIIFDGKDILNYTELIEAADIAYYSIGRPDIQ